MLSANNSPSIFDPPQASGATPKPATGIIHYEYKGRSYAWRVACMTGETEQDLRAHLGKWIPEAVFKSAEIVIETKKA